MIQQQKGGIREGLVSCRQGKDTSTRGLSVMRDPTKAIMGREQTCEPVVEETLPTCVTRNPRNKQIVSKHCKSSWLCRSSEAICGCKNMWRAGEIPSLLVLQGHTYVALSPSNNASVWLYVGVSQGTDALDHVRSEFNEG